MSRLLPLLLILLAALASAGSAPAASPTRTFRLDYAVEVGNLPPNSREVEVWLPLPQSDANQTVGTVRLDVPAPVELLRETEYGNSVLHARIPVKSPGAVTARLEATVSRRENAGRAEPLDAATRERLLAPDRLVPTDGKIRALAQQATLGLRSETEKARGIYNYVTRTMAYDKTGMGWGRGDALYACDAKRGNCTDFHALIIGMARSIGLPARFSIGFSLPEKHGQGEIPGYHCWAEIYADGRWIPVDSSEAAKNPLKRDYYFGHHDENRVQFTTGRDLKVDPAPAESPLNYLIYPVVQVDGKPLAEVKTRFTFTDLAQ